VIKSGNYKLKYLRWHFLLVEIREGTWRGDLGGPKCPEKVFSFIPPLIGKTTTHEEKSNFFVNMKAIL
jgi:hypothetical protein